MKKLIFVIISFIAFPAFSQSNINSKEHRFASIVGIGFYVFGVSADAYITQKNFNEKDKSFNQAGARMFAGFGLALFVLNIPNFRSERIELKSSGNGLTLAYKF